jgi:hypothetical protein
MILTLDDARHDGGNDDILSLFGLSESARMTFGSDDANQEFVSLLTARLRDLDTWAWCLSGEDRNGRAYALYCETHSEVQRKYLGTGSY